MEYLEIKLDESIEIKTESYDDSNEFIDISQLSSEFVLKPEKTAPTETYQRPLKCKYCDKRCSTDYGLQVHLKSHHLLTCALCDAKFTSSSNFKDHIRMHALKTIRPKPEFVCSICKFSAKSIHMLKIHEQIHVNFFKHKKIRCNLCDATFVNNAVLKEHRLHNHLGEVSSAHQCKICGQTFTRGYSLKVHEIVHTGEKPFKCAICDQEFNREWNLKVHQKIHTGEKPFKCTFCDKAFTVRGYLKKHVLSHNTHIDNIDIDLQ